MTGAGSRLLFCRSAARRSVFMILDQLNIATNIVFLTYAALVGAVALGMALAFGLGGREVASRLLENAYIKGQESKRM
jgi:hypothetical protein